jgi:hypothetical protein
MSAATRNQRVLAEISTLSISVPVAVVFQESSMVRPSTLTSRVVPPSFLIPTQADELRSKARPAMSPSVIALMSISMVVRSARPTPTRE